MNKPFKIVKLRHGVVVNFFDQSNRYFGDYHQIKISALATVPVKVSSLPNDLQKSVTSNPATVIYEKHLKRMGVATASRESVIEILIAAFIRSVGSYLENEDFAEHLLRQKVFAGKPHPRLDL